VASGSPPFRRGFLPVLVAWALAPALLLAAAGSFGIGHLNLPSTAAGDVLGLIALLGGPFILYGWSAYLLRYKRVPSWGLKAVPLTLGMCIVNLVAGIGGCSLFGSLL
jgi:hypothetical protein